MATIQNAITMQDRMTPVFNKMIKAMQSTLKVMEQVDRQANKGVSSRAFKSAERSIQQATNSVLQFSNGVNRANQESSRLNQSMGRLSSLGAKAFSVQAIASLVQNVGSMVDRGAKYLDNLNMISARINLINDGMQSTGELQDKILKSANQTGAEYQTMAHSFAKLNLLAGDAFKSNDESFRFLDTLNKALVVSGASAEETNSAMYQLTQAMASGKLQGDEFRSLTESAPMLIQAIADSLGTSKGALKELASEGKLTSDIVKNAMLGASDTINKQFETMPKTWAMVTQALKNNFAMAMSDLSAKFGEFMNSDKFQSFLYGVGNVLNFIAKLLYVVFEVFVFVFNGIYDLCIMLSPVLWMIGFILLVWAVSMIPTAIMALWGLISALATATMSALAFLFSLLMTNWVALLVVVAIGLIIWVALEMGFTFGEVIGFIIGLFFGLLAVVFNVVIWFYNMFMPLATFLANLFIDPVGAIKMLFWEMCEGILQAINGVVQALISLVNMIPGVNVQFDLGIDKMMAKVQEAKATVSATHKVKQTNKMEYKNVGGAFNKGMNIGKNFGGGGSKGGGSKKPGMAWSGGGGMPGMSGGGKKPKMSKPGGGGGNPTGGKLDEIGKIKDDVKITEEDIKLLKDLAQTQFVNKYTTLQPNMKIEFTGDIKETADVNKLLEAIEVMTEDALATTLI